jgi:superfamily II DNA/RNA helicase
MVSFAELSLTSFLADRLRQAGFTAPTPIQSGPLFRWPWRGAIC